MSTDRNRTRGRSMAVAILTATLLYAGAFGTAAAFAYEHHAAPDVRFITLTATD